MTTAGPRTSRADEPAGHGKRRLVGRGVGVRRLEVRQEERRKKRPHPLILLFLTLQALAWLFFAFVVAGMVIAVASEIVWLLTG